MTGSGMFRVSEKESVHGGHRPGTKGENIPDDASDPGGCSLVGRHRGRVIVAFRLERRSKTVSEVDDSGVFTWSEDDLRPPCGEMLKKMFRGLVAAVLRPHNPEDPEFAFIGLPSEGGFDGGEELDPLFDQAVNFVTEKRKASISGVQRQFRIGYNRAARIIEQMEAQGIVSEQGHNGNREVLAPPPFD